MNLFFILLLLAFIAAGYYVYQRLLKIEREIRADQSVLVEEEDSAIVPDIGPASPEPAQKVADSDALAEEIGLKEQIMSAVEGSPGLAQAEIYDKFPGEDRRELQKLLRQLDQNGQLRREKKGSSYMIYPL